MIKKFNKYRLINESISGNLLIGKKAILKNPHNALYRNGIFIDTQNVISWSFTIDSFKFINNILLIINENHTFYNSNNFEILDISKDELEEIKNIYIEKKKRFIE